MPPYLQCPLGIDVEQDIDPLRDPFPDGCPWSPVEGSVDLGPLEKRVLLDRAPERRFIHKVGIAGFHIAWTRLSRGARDIIAQVRRECAELMAERGLAG